MKKYAQVVVVAMIFMLTGMLQSQGPVSGAHRLNSRLLGPVTEKPDLAIFKEIRYISSTTGSDKKGDGTREKPWQTIAHALQNISGRSAQQRCALIVAAGRYMENTLVMQPHTDLYGGFDPASWERDIFKYSTILDGQGVRRVVIAADSARIDGFRIVNGRSLSHGAGILCDDTSPQITNNFITGNTVMGPAAFNHTRIHQEGNQGGGIAVRYNAVPVIRNNLICGNRTAIGNGAGIAFYGWVRIPGMPGNKTVDNRITGGVQAVVENNVIMHNRAGVDDLYRTRSSNGGGISVAFEARPLITNNLIAMNDAGGRGDAGGIYIEYFSDPDVIGNWILGNASDDDGGGLYTMRLGQPLIEGNIFAGNYTRSGGAGAIRLSKEGRAVIRANLLARNPGGGITAVDSYMEAVDNIIAQNTGRPGISVSNKFTYFKPSLISGNIFIDNPEGTVDVSGTENVEVRPATTEKSSPAVIRIEPVKVRHMRYDAESYLTRVVPENVGVLDDRLAGKVVYMGDTWSLVKSVGKEVLFVWGDLTDSAGGRDLLEFLPAFEF